MEKIKKLFAHKIFKIFMWVFLILVGIYVAWFIIYLFSLQSQGKTDIQVAKIHATKLTMDDVLGKNLPLDPGTEANKTVAGIDANKNGIRDDVENAIFKSYPNSAKTRAVLLQFALVLQTQAVLPIVNTNTVTATAEEKSRALNCIWSISSRADMKKFVLETDKNENFIKQLQFNTEQRKKAQDDFYNFLGSYSRSHESCDLDLTKLPN